MQTLRTSRIYACILTLGDKDRKRIFLMTVVQISINLLDLFGVAIVGVLGALTVTGIRSQQPGSRVTRVMTFAHLETFSLQ